MERAHLEPPRSLYAGSYVRACGIRSHKITKHGLVPAAPTRSSKRRFHTASPGCCWKACIDASHRRGGPRRRRGCRTWRRWWPTAPTTGTDGQSLPAHRRRPGQLVRAAAGRAACDSTRKQRDTGEMVRTCADEGEDQDGRGGGLAMPHGHLQRARAAHHHVRQQRDRARREGEWEGAEIDGS